MSAQRALGWAADPRCFRCATECGFFFWTKHGVLEAVCGDCCQRYARLVRKLLA